MPRVAVDQQLRLEWRRIASVSALVFHHPEARYFGIGRIGRDQVEDYAERKGMAIDTAERWLASLLGY